MSHVFYGTERDSGVKDLLVVFTEWTDRNWKEAQQVNVQIMMQLFF